MKSPVYFISGKYVSVDNAKISVRDLGLVRGFGLFEALRTYQGEPFLLRIHLQRLFRGIKIIGLKSPISLESMEKIIKRLLYVNRIRDGIIRIVLTGGITKLFFPDGEPTLIIMADPLPPFASWQYEKGIKLMTTRFARIHPEIKTTVYFSGVLATMQAVKRGFTEVVYVDKHGAIIEGTTFNVFAVLPGPRLITAKDHILKWGTTADCVIKIAKKLKITVQRTPISQNMLRHAQELFITSANRELIPAIRVDQQRIGNGKPGELTRQLHAAYQDMVQTHINGA